MTLLDIKTKFVLYWNTKYYDQKGLKKSEKDIINKVISEVEKKASELEN